MLYKIMGTAIGAGVGYAAKQLGNYGAQILSEHYDKIPLETTKAIAFTAATGVGFLVGHDYYTSKKLAHIYGHE